MKNKLSARVFSYIAGQISQGRPVNAMLWANEYLSSDSQLYAALRVKSMRKIDSSRRDPRDRKIIREIFRGAKCSELPRLRDAEYLHEPAPRYCLQDARGHAFSFAGRRAGLGSLGRTSCSKAPSRRRFLRRKMD